MVHKTFVRCIIHKQCIANMSVVILKKQNIKGFMKNKLVRIRQTHPWAIIKNIIFSFYWTHWILEKYRKHLNRDFHLKNYEYIRFWNFYDIKHIFYFDFPNHCIWRSLGMYHCFLALNFLSRTHVWGFFLGIFFLRYFLRFILFFIN
jgi:hypothetical protein